MTRTRGAWLLTIAGGGLVVAGVALLSVPLALVVAGVGIAALGLLTVEVRP